MKVVCVIPARLGSMRFPRKVVHDLCGKPIVQWVWEAAIGMEIFDEVLFAVDSEELGDCIESFGGRYELTSKGCNSGTERLIELQQRGVVSGDIWVNWQADEPFINEDMISDLLQRVNDESIDVWTLKKKIGKEKAKEPSVVKVVSDNEGNALYFSRSMIPYGAEGYFWHVGLYAYRDRALEKMRSFGECALEKAEKLEQLRFLANGMKIFVGETKETTVGIDLPEHLEEAQRVIKSLLAL